MIRLLSLGALLATVMSQAQSDTSALVERLAAAQTAHQEAAVTEALAQLTDAIGTADHEALSVAIPEVVRSADDADPKTRELAMLALISATGRTRADGSLSGDALPLLAAHLPAIARHLSDASLPVRQVTVLVLGGFEPSPSAGAIQPLIACLGTADAPATIGPGAMYALLTLGIDDPAHPEIAEAILRFLRREDLPPGSFPKLLAAVAQAPAHSATLDAGVAEFAGSQRGPEVRSAAIAVLPKLQMSQRQIDAMRVVLRRSADDPKEDRSVRAGAAAVLPCWHSPRMSEPCPALPVRYRMVAPPRPAIPVTPPRYESPPIS